MMIDRLAPSRESSASVIGWPLNRSVPRLPCSSRSSQCQYCTGSGWSMPNWCRTRWYCSGV
jgi:hypothetical protein